MAGKEKKGEKKPDKKGGKCPHCGGKLDSKGKCSKCSKKY